MGLSLKGLGDAISDGVGWIDDNLSNISDVAKEGGQLLDTLGIIDYKQTADQVAAARTQVGSSIADSNVGQSLMQDQFLKYLPYALGLLILVMVIKK
jgi:hypothetical protein